MAGHMRTVRTATEVSVAVAVAVAGGTRKQEAPQGPVCSAVAVAVVASVSAERLTVLWAVSAVAVVAVERFIQAAQRQPEVLVAWVLCYFSGRRDSDHEIRSRSCRYCG